MTDVLFLAYHYPPMTSVGTRRARGFVFHLPGYGYRPHVVTTAAYGTDDGSNVYRAHEILEFYRYMFNRKQRSLPPEERSFSRTDAGVFKQWVRRLKELLLIPDGQVGWLPHAFWTGLEVVRKKEIRLIYSTGPPFSTHLLGMAIRHATGLPWVADFRDTWTYDPLYDFLQDETSLRFQIESELEAAVLERADRVVGVTGVACDDFRRRFPNASGRIRCIPNGFDPEDFPQRPPVSSLRSDGPMYFVHTGSFSYSHPLRTPEPLFQALEAWYGDEPDLPGRVRLVLVGALHPAEQRRANFLVRAGLVELTGPLRRSEAMVWQQKADVLALVDHPRNVRASNVPGKCYEYLASAKPILALVGDGATRDLLVELQAGVCTPPQDAAGIRRGMEELLLAHRTGTLKDLQAAPEALRPFYQSETAKALAQCFDEALAEKLHKEG